MRTFDFAPLYRSTVGFRLGLFLLRAVLILRRTHPVKTTGG